MADIPNLAGVATQDLVEEIGGGRFKASYINWSRTMHLLREHAPGWMLEAVPGEHGLIHAAPDGGYLLLRFVHADGTTTPPVPQAIMDHKNNAIPLEKITARNVTDTHRRGACLAAAMIFGLAYELWAKMPLESGYDDTPVPKKTPDYSARVEGLRVAVDSLTPEKIAATRTRIKDGYFGPFAKDATDILDLIGNPVVDHA